MKFLSLKSLSAFLLMLITGCASNNVVDYWSKPEGFTDEEYRMDIAQCENEALINHQQSNIEADTAGQAILLGMIAGNEEANRERAIVETCMEAKGYILTQSNIQTTVATPRRK
ncbi:MAG TPA: hypothetical protein VGN23_08850 [Verrucomicrobiae bacterium]|jgi:hypothetical protein